MCRSVTIIFVRVLWLDGHLLKRKSRLLTTPPAMMDLFQLFLQSCRKVLATRSLLSELESMRDAGGQLGAKERLRERKSDSI